MSLTINANHTSSYYLRNFYSSNRSAASTDSYRSRSSNHTLVLADSEALKKAAEALSDLDYDDSDEANGGDIYNSITAFVTAYNNFMDSSSSSDYGYIKNQKNHIKDLISEHSSDLESIGITINTKGKLEIDDDELGSAKLTKLKRIFSDSGDLSSSLQKYATSAFRYEKNHVPQTGSVSNSSNDTASDSASTDSTDTATTMAELTGKVIGSNVDLVL